MVKHCDIDFSALTPHTITMKLWKVSTCVILGCTTQLETWHAENRAYILHLYICEEILFYMGFPTMLHSRIVPFEA